MDCFTLEDGTNSLSRNVSNKHQSTLRKIPEGCKSHLHFGRSLKSQRGCMYLQGSTTGSYIVLVESRPHLHILLSAPSKYYPLIHIYIYIHTHTHQCPPRYISSLNLLNKIFHIFLLSSKILQPLLIQESLCWTKKGYYSHRDLMKRK